MVVVRLSRFYNFGIVNIGVRVTLDSYYERRGASWWGTTRSLEGDEEEGLGVKSVSGNIRNRDFEERNERWINLMVLRRLIPERIILREGLYSTSSSFLELESILLFIPRKNNYFPIFLIQRSKNSMPTNNIKIYLFVRINSERLVKINSNRSCFLSFFPFL